MASTEKNRCLVGKTRIFDGEAATYREGHFIGQDGFVVPNSFAEFHERFPTYVADWVRKRVRGCVSKHEAEDWTQELLLHLAALPRVSVWRERGKEDVIQTYSPERMQGANQARFRSFINNCLTNKFNTLYAKWRKGPLSNPANLSVGWNPDHDATDEFCHANSAYLRRLEVRKRQHHEARFMVAESRLVKSVPDASYLFEAFRKTGNWEEAAALSAMTTSRLASVRQKVTKLGNSLA